MRGIAKRHKHEHISVAGDYVGEQLRMEIREYAAEHRHAHREVGISEEHPCEADEMKRQQAAEKTSHAAGTVVAVVVEDIFADILVNGQCHTVHAAPYDEVPAGPMPDTCGKPYQK